VSRILKRIMLIMYEQSKKLYWMIIGGWRLTIYLLLLSLFMMFLKNRYGYDYSSFSVWDVGFNDWRCEEDYIPTWRKGKAQVEHSSIFEAVNSVLIDRWTKSIYIYISSYPCPTLFQLDVSSCPCRVHIRVRVW